LIALSIGAPAKSLWFAAVCTVGSLIGAAGGYFLGYEFFELIGKPIVEFYSAEEAYETARQMYQEWDVIAVAVAGFTPIPYKVITITAGAFRLNFATFLLVSAVSRAARFFLVGALIRWLGPSIKEVIDRYFNILTIVFGGLLVGGFLILKYVI
jgi:membrane protein YqaA with SNARE-associated domain